MRGSRRVTALLCVSLFASAATAGEVVRLPQPGPPSDAFRCHADTCVVPTVGSYPHLVMGRFALAATAAQGEQLFQDMRAKNRWPALPPGASRFAATLQAVAIQLEDGQSLTVLMSQEEARAAPIERGDLVRYSPHRGVYELPPDDVQERAYWSIDGCVAVICRAADASCFERYAAGVFRARDGVAISPRTFEPLHGKPAIDPDTLLPRPAQDAD